MKTLPLLTLLLYCTPLVAAAQAQSVDFPNKEQIAGAAKEASEIFMRLDPGYKGLDKVTPDAAAKAPNITPSPTNFSVEELAKKYAAPPPPPESGRKQHADLLVFVTLSMPKESLKRLARQTAAVGGVLVLRGLLKGSLKETARAVKEISETAAWQINPPAFTRYNVKAAPSFVMTRDARQNQVSSNEAGCAPPQSFIAISGDVSLSYALEAIERESREWRADAALYLAKAAKGGG